MKRKGMVLCLKFKKMNELLKNDMFCMINAIQYAIKDVQNVPQHIL